MADANAKCRFGVVVPPANPAVEPEMRVLLPQDAVYHVTRLPVFPDTTLYERNALYLKAYPESLHDFGALPLDAISIAMTGSSYRLLSEGDEKMCRDLSAQASVPVVTASVAIAMVLRALNVRTIAMVSPYPTELTDQAQTYWRSAGFDLVQMHAISTEFKAYVLTEAEVFDALSQIDTTAVDATLLSGTGAVTVSALLDITEKTGAQFLSSNVCSAAVLWSVSGLEAPDVLKRILPALFEPGAAAAEKLRQQVRNLSAPGSG